MTLTLPTLHLNGSHPNDLLEAQLAAMNACRALLAALPQPNPRDYYPQGEGAFAAAVAQYEAQVVAVREVLTQLEAVAEHIHDERDQRDQRRR
jgi:hypothetical protein